jgi:hypothetical protein
MTKTNSSIGTNKRSTPSASSNVRRSDIREDFARHQTPRVSSPVDGKPSSLQQQQQQQQNQFTDNNEIQKNSNNDHVVDHDDGDDDDDDDDFMMRIVHGSCQRCFHDDTIESMGGKDNNAGILCRDDYLLKGCHGTFDDHLDLFTVRFVQCKEFIIK